MSVANRCSSANCRWDMCQEDCSHPGTEFLGLVGYLATVTSTEELEVLDALPSSGYLGGSDAAAEGQYKWVTGPEGCPPYTATSGPMRSACNLGYPLPDSFDPCTGPECGGGSPLTVTNWRTGEPNEYTGDCGDGTCKIAGEDFLSCLSTKWVDVSLKYPMNLPHLLPAGYVCEWGGIGELCVNPESIAGSRVIRQDACCSLTEAQCHAAPACVFEGGECAVDVLEYRLNQNVNPFPTAAPCDPGGWGFTGGCSCDTDVYGALVTIVEGYEAGADTLQCPDCATHSLVATFDTAGGFLKITGPDKLEKYALVMAGLEFTSTSSSMVRRHLRWNLGTGALLSSTGHWYQKFSKDQISDGLSFRACRKGGQTVCVWDKVQAECADPENDFFGLVGYLATITTPGEQAWMDVLGAEGYIGASDAGAEGFWRWVTGPEGCPPYIATSGPARSACDLGYPLAAVMDPCTGPDCMRGTQIGNMTPTGFLPVSTQYFTPGEPNNFDQPCPGGTCDTTGEDYAAIKRPDGKWEDRCLGYEPEPGYVCEWGGVGDLCVQERRIRGGRWLQHSPCANLAQAPCESTPGCVFNVITAECEQGEDECGPANST
eukprot:Hpha_TRINITY_DN16889_c1_g1::TRINITY_DN16889_c1_g1_i1::g.148258::m.148258